MIAFSFNEGKSRAKWEGFSFKWYARLFENADILDALKVTLIVAAIATVVSVILGTLGAIGIHACKKGYASAMINLSYLPMTMPDIVTGVSLMMMFTFSLPMINPILSDISAWLSALFKKDIDLTIERGMFTMILAHITFDTPYVLFSVLPKLKQMDPNSYEAALDLGCRPMTAIRKVIIPEISPGIITGALLALTMSLDDFVISYFTTEKTQNLSILVYSAAKRGVKPDIYALSTIMFLTVLALLIVVNKRSTLEDIG
ncbi:MAG: ABC transporter permease [Clostridia bacterium]|nr:ABC transporter permease [Clostridia bacterium]